MKSLVLCFACVAVISLMLMQAEASSMPRCATTCDRNRCPKVDCQCGAVTDSCNCCDVCKVCPNQACHLIRSDVCADGYSCTHPPGSSSIDRMNSPGTCLQA